MALVELGIGRLHWLLASGASFAATMPCLRVGNSILEKVLPKDESSVVSVKSFVGRIATVMIGTVTNERSAEAKVIGPNGKPHYIQVVADNEGKTFKQGDHVLIVGRRSESVFTVIENKNPLLETVE